MIIQDPLEFFNAPEHVVVINIVDIVNRFTNVIYDYLVDLTPAYINNTGSKVVLLKTDRLTDKDGQAVKFEDFLNLDGDYFINDDIVKMKSAYSRRNYRLRTKTSIATEILIAFVKDDISKRSNWEAVYDVYEAIADYIDPKYDVNDVCGFIVERIDPFIMSIVDHYHNRDWNIHEVECDGFRLTLTRYGDWRAYMWNKDQYEQRELKDSGD